MKAEAVSEDSSAELLANDKLQRTVDEILTKNLERILAARSSLDPTSSAISQKLSCEAVTPLTIFEEKYDLRLSLELFKLP